MSEKLWNLKKFRGSTRIKDKKWVWPIKVIFSPFLTWVDLELEQIQYNPIKNVQS
jgi:hypothetical protein